MNNPSSPCNTKKQSHFQLQKASHEIEFIKRMVKSSSCRIHLVPVDPGKQAEELQHPRQGPESNNILSHLSDSFTQGSWFSNSDPFIQGCRFSFDTSSSNTGLTLFKSKIPLNSFVNQNTSNRIVEYKFKA